MLTIGSLFSGIGGLELGLEWAGLGPTLYQVEIDPYCRKVLERHWPDAARFEDISTVGATVLPRVDLICGGSPCQDVSSAGKGAGLTGARSGLWREFRRIVAECRPPWVVVENVASGARRWLCQVRDDLHELGYRTRALGISARDVGAPHLRRRIFVVAYPNGSPVRLEQQRQPRRRTDGLRHQGQALPLDYGSKEPLANTYPIDGHAGDEYHGQKQWPLQQGHGRASQGEWWSIEPNVGRVAHGVSRRVDRLRGLGNAVVPQQAQIVGLVIRQIIAREAHGLLGFG